ncbi:MAG: M28 family peptidase [Acidobacteriota bacterium]
MSFKQRVFNRAIALALFLSLTASGVGAFQSEKYNVTADMRAAMDRISADSLRGHLSFIASDLLEGRNTPSRGLDIAAEYIAAQFRRAGLEPAGDDGYFQTANWKTKEPNLDGFELKIQHDSQTIHIDSNRVSITLDAALDLANAGAVKVDFNDRAALAAMTAEQMAGKVVLTEMPDTRRADQSQRVAIFRAQNEFFLRMSELKVALVISIDRAGQRAAAGRLIDPESSAPPRATTWQMIAIHDLRAARLFDTMKAGATGATVTLHLAAPAEKPLKLRNVIGILRGSDPQLKDTYVLVTAHYDHIGIRADAPGDNIFNGANDDGSGTVSVIELASALSSLKQKPRRSIVFMTFFGEEKGLLGSRYYGRHPVFPIERTVANINLEQVGRTDSSEGPQLANASMTGFDFSDVGLIFKAAGEMTGINVYKHERNSDVFFSRSDNQALADQGVPAHTLCVAYVYPDYHGAGDHWDKINYENMAKVNRCIALAVVMIAENPQPPKWNEANPRTARYVKAWKQRHGQ